MRLNLRFSDCPRPFGRFQAAALRQGFGRAGSGQHVAAFEVVSEPKDLVAVRTAVQTGGWDYESADATFLPSMSVDLDVEGAKKVFKLLEALEECDDVQNVFANFDVSDDVMADLD